MTGRMGLRTLTSGLLATTLLASPVFGEAVLDGTTGSTGSFSGDFEIPAEVGRRAGANLFHSFERFHIRLGESATFIGPTGIDNVVSRVTGDEASSIDGVLRSTVPGADFWFLNPRGVVFGQNASLDLPGSFHVSTADELRFSDGSVFSATDPDASSFTVAAPEAFGFVGDAPGSILVDRGQLAVDRGRDLSLVGGEVTVTAGNDGVASGGQSGRILAPGGTLTLAAVTGPAAIEPGTGNFTADAGLDLTLMEEASIDASDGGAIRIRSGRFVLEGGSMVSAVNTDGFPAGDGIALEAGTVSIADGSSLLTRSDGDGSAGPVGIRAGDITIGGESLVGSVTFGAGAAGDVSVQAAGALDLGDGSRINSDTVAGGAAGAVVVTADQLTIRDNAQIRSQTFGSGDAGAVLVEAGQILIRNSGTDGRPAGILSDADVGSTGDGGGVAVEAEEIRLEAGGQIRSLTFGEGDAGGIVIVADRLRITADGLSVFPTGVLSSAESGSSGDAGAVLIGAEEIELIGGGQIRALTFSSGNGGAIAIETGDLTIAGDGFTDLATA